MNDILQIAAIGLLGGKQRLEAISQNAASASLPGYRRQVFTGRAFDAQAFGSLLAASGVDAPARSGEESSAVSADALGMHKVDLRAGEMIATGRPLDIAIDGEDAFVALTDGERTWLSRAGALRLDAAGVLIGEGGLRVVGTAGDVQLPGEDVQVEADGRISHEGRVVAALQLFTPTDRSSLRAGPGTLLSAGDIQPADPSAARVRSGMLEASNTDSAREMLSLMTLSRQFEGLAQLMQGYDAALARVIERLGEG